MREPIHTEHAPRAVGPYSQAIRVGAHVWVSGQIGLDPASGRLVDGGVEAEARQALDNLAAVLQAAGSGMQHVVRATVYLLDMGDFERVNAVYAERFAEDPPSRVCVQVAGLPKGARVEIDALAVS